MEEKQQQRIVFLKGKKVVLRPLNKSIDLQPCLRWMNDPEVRQFIKRHLPLTEQEESEWFDNLAKRPNDIILAIETLEGVFIGTIGLHRIDWKDRTAITGACIGEKEYWGKGYGRDAKMLLLHYAFNTLNLRKICSSVLAFNERSLKYNLRCGYQEEGRRRRQVFNHGQYHDEILMAIFREDWPPLWEEYQK